MQKQIQSKKTPVETLKNLAALKKRETELMSQLSLVRSEMLRVGTSIRDDLEKKKVDELKVAQHPQKTGVRTLSHKDALIAVLSHRGPMLLKHLCQTALDYGAETRAKKVSDPFHAVLCRNQDIFFQMGNGYWGLTQKYRDENFK
ncbi:MAG: hypothetical protein M0R32_09585 [Candidatus Cloacimonetes bacterium]|jgi:hypothetical protein|nr:hypothetical protein [Candidatus Cloacimonadota bacterium]